MLDFVLTFSLPKLVFDNEVCGQSLHFIREIEVLDDLPTGDLVADLMRDDHLITSRPGHRQRESRNLGESRQSYAGTSGGGGSGATTGSIPASRD